MEPVTPPKPRHITEDVGGSLVITLTSDKKYWLLLPFYLLYMLIGIMTIVPFLFIFAATIILFFPGLLPETYTGQINLSPVDAGFILVPFLCSLPLFAFWLILFISVVKRILWLFGKEVFEVRGDMLTIHRVVLGIKRSQEYQASEIQNLRLYDRASDRSRKRTILNAYFANVLVNKGLIAFEHQGKTIRFANDVDEAEAKQILSKINRVIDLYHP